MSKTRMGTLSGLASIVLAASLPVAAANTPEANARAAIKAIAPTMVVEAVAPAAMPGYQEVLVGGQVVYVSNDGRYLVQGSVLDMKTRTDLTEARKVKARQVALAKIPASERISFPAKNEKYRVLVFTDIDCGWCRKMHQQIADYNKAGITVDYLFFPRAGLQGEAYTQAVAVWCSKNKHVALTQAKAGQKLTGPTTCKNPVADQFNLGMRLGVSGTPAIYAVSGVDMRGYKAPQEMATALAALNVPAKPVAAGTR